MFLTEMHSFNLPPPGTFLVPKDFFSPFSGLQMGRGGGGGSLQLNTVFQKGEEGSLAK